MTQAEVIQLQSENARLQEENMQLKIVNVTLGTFISDMFEACLPISKEIAGAKGLFKVFKVFKLAINLVKYIIDFFDQKPNLTRFY